MRACGSTRSRPARFAAARSQQQTERLTLSAQRGTIFDRNGKVLAVSEDSSTVYANPLLIKNPGATATRLAPLLHLPDERAAGEARATARKGFVYLARKIDIDVGAQGRRS